MLDISPFRTSRARRLAFVGAAAVSALLASLALPAASRANLNVYVANHDAAKTGANSNVSQYERAAGVLEGLTPPMEEAGVRPVQPVVSPDERALYVTNEGSGGGAGTISQYYFGPHGALHSMARATVKTGVEPGGIAVAKLSNGNSYAYVAVKGGPGEGSGRVWEYEIDKSTDELVEPPVAQALSGKVTKIVVAPNQECAYVSSSNGGVYAYRIIGSSGELEEKTGKQAGKNPQYLAVTHDSKHLYVTISGENKVAEYQIEAGCRLSDLSETFVSTGTTPVGIAVEQPLSRYAYVANEGSGNVSEYKIESGTGTLIPLSPATITADKNPTGIAITPDAKNVYVSDNGSTSVSEYAIEAFGQLEHVAFPHETILAGMEPEGIAMVTEVKAVPFVATAAPSSVTHTSATLHATVNPNGSTVTQCEFEYGTTIAYGKSAPCSPMPGSGESPVAVSASATGLSENTTYHFRISATNPVGTRKSSDKTFTTSPPEVLTGPASSITVASATLTGEVNPNGVEVTGCKFEYGLTNAYGKSAPCTPTPGSGEVPVAVSASVTGLSKSTTYHFRISATNSLGTSNGSDHMFTTLATAPPTVVTGAASSITGTSATLNATVTPDNLEVTECKFEYGTTIAYGKSAACMPMPGSGESPVAVSASIMGLSEATTYHFRISATNSAGNSKGSDQTFTTLPVKAHWYANGSRVGAAPVGIISWGTLANMANKAAGEGTIECHDVAAGLVTNPEGGGVGEGLTQEFASYECSGNMPCAPGHEQAVPVAASLRGASGGWPSKLEEPSAGEIRVNTTGVEVELGCVEPPEFNKVTGATFVTSATALQNPLGPSGTRKGTSPAAPGMTVFDEKAGELEVKGSGGAAKGRTTGTLKTLGYEEQELIQIRAP